MLNTGFWPKNVIVVWFILHYHCITPALDQSSLQPSQPERKAWSPQQLFVLSTDRPVQCEHGVGHSTKVLLLKEVVSLEDVLLVHPVLGQGFLKPVVESNISSWSFWTLGKPSRRNGNTKATRISSSVSNSIKGQITSMYVSIPNPSPVMIFKSQVPVH